MILHRPEEKQKIPKEGTNAVESDVCIEEEWNKAKREERRRGGKQVRR